MRKLKEIEKKYGVDFGQAKGMTLYLYLKKIGFPSLAELIKLKNRGKEEK